MGKYDDIIDLPRHRSRTRQAMATINRAAQFAPFDALSGYGEAIEDLKRPREERVQLSQDQKDMLDAKVSYLEKRKDQRESVEIIYFQEDPCKPGGQYRTRTGSIAGFVRSQAYLLMDDGFKINIKDIYNIKSDSFEAMVFRQ